VYGVFHTFQTADDLDGRIVGPDQQLQAFLRQLFIFDDQYFS